MEAWLGFGSRYAGYSHRSVGLESAKADFVPFQRRVSNPSTSNGCATAPGEVLAFPRETPRRARYIQNRGIAAHPCIAYNRPIRAETLLPWTR